MVSLENGQDQQIAELALRVVLANTVIEMMGHVASVMVVEMIIILVRTQIQKELNGYPGLLLQHYLDI